MRTWLRGLSLRTRLLLIALGLLAASLAIGNLVVVDVLQRQQLGRIDDQIRRPGRHTGGLGTGPR